MFSQSFPEDAIAIVTNDEFYGYVRDEGDAFLNKFPERKGEVHEYLIIIKNTLNVV